LFIHVSQIMYFVIVSKYIVTCILGGICRHFSDTCCQTPYNGSSKMPVHIYQTTRRHIPEDCHLRIHHRENLTFHTSTGNVAVGYSHISPQTALTSPYPWQSSLVSFCCFSCSK